MIELSLEYPRREGMMEVVYSFIVKSTIARGHIPNKLRSVKQVLTGLMCEGQYLEHFEVRYLIERPSEETIQVGEVGFDFDWTKHSLEVANGRDKIHLDREDPLGSLSPALSTLANRIRALNLRDGSNSLTYSVRFIGSVYEDEDLYLSLCAAHSLATKPNPNNPYARAKKRFDQSPSRTYELTLENAAETSFFARWRVDD